jgi:hypothetical protein
VRRAILLAAALAAGAAAAEPSPSAARGASARECHEASDFIRNAAHARDNGMSRSTFLERLREDLAAIRTFPAALRWFARTASDEAFLVAEAERVFDAPLGPELHRPGFLARCLARD